jgi:hypothetical protein
MDRVSSFEFRKMGKTLIAHQAGADLRLYIGREVIDYDNNPDYAVRVTGYETSEKMYQQYKKDLLDWANRKWEKTDRSGMPPTLQEYCSVIGQITVKGDPPEFSYMSVPWKEAETKPRGEIESIRVVDPASCDTIGRVHEVAFYSVDDGELDIRFEDGLYVIYVDGQWVEKYNGFYGIRVRRLK